MTREQLVGADPCGFLDTTTLARFGTVTVEPDQSFDTCRASISGLGDSSATVTVTVTLQPDSPSTPPGERPPQPRTIDGVTVYSLPDSAPRGPLGSLLEMIPGCGRAVVAFDDAVIYLSATGEPKPADPYLVLDALAEVVVRQLVHGEIKPASYPASSLAKQDACRLLEPAEAARVPGSDGTVHPSYGGHSCTWGNDSIAEPSAFLALSPAEPPTPTDETGRTITILGHQAVVQPRLPDDLLVQIYGPSLPYCDVEILYQSLIPPYQNWVETVSVTVSADRDPASLCTLATELATAALRRLPPT